jgi:hypothetical protein
MLVGKKMNNIPGQFIQSHSSVRNLHVLGSLKESMAIQQTSSTATEKSPI